jgi:TonB family protein
MLTHLSVRRTLAGYDRPIKPGTREHKIAKGVRLIVGLSALLVLSFPFTFLLVKNYIKAGSERIGVSDGSGLTPPKQPVEFEYDGKRDTGFAGYTITKLFSNESEVKFRLPGQDRDELAVTGLPTGVPGPPSAGRASAGGKDAGSGFRVGGGDTRLPGFAGAPATIVDTRPILLNNRQPRYTEEARKNKVQGTVLVRVLIGSDGQVKRATVIRGLPDGLDEQAIQAAYQLRFTPAMKNGQSVAYWMPIAIEFNLR